MTALESPPPYQIASDLIKGNPVISKMAADATVHESGLHMV